MKYNIKENDWSYLKVLASFFQQQLISLFLRFDSFFIVLYHNIDTQENINTEFRKPYLRVLLQMRIGVSDRMLICLELVIVGFYQ